MCSTDVLSVSKAGFVGELFILYATSLGVATCWFGHYSAAVLNRVMPHLTDEEVTRLPKWGCGSSEASGVRAICITPLGYWRRQGARLLDRFTQAAMSSKRRPIRELLHPYVDERLIKPEVLYALDLARMAPSAANSQPWRFAVRSGGEQVQIYAPQGYKHLKWEHPDVDIGISASHFWLGLKMQQVQCQVIPEVRDGQAVWTFELK